MVTGSAFAETQGMACFSNDERVSLGGAEVSAKIVAHISKS